MDSCFHRNDKMGKSFTPLDKQKATISRGKKMKNKANLKQGKSEKVKGKIENKANPPPADKFVSSLLTSKYNRI